MVSCKRAFIINRYFCQSCQRATVTGRSRYEGTPAFESWFSTHYRLLSVNGKPLGIVPIGRADVPKQKKKAKVAAT
jgi:hypothetical protein